MDRDNDAGLVRRTVEDGVTAFLTVQLKTKLFCYADEVFGVYLRKERCHAATWMGLMITSSAGTGSERAFKLSIYN